MYVVGRELCLFTSVDARKVPQKQRSAFVELAVRRAAPFDDPDHGFAWTAPDQAAAWYWSRSRVAEVLGPQDSRRAGFLPEAIFTAAPRDYDTSELLELHHGFEGRIWRNGRLVASRWLPALPLDSEWQAFLRSAGVAATSGEPAPASVPAPIAQEAWGRRQERGGLGTRNFDALLPRAALLLGACALLALTLESGRLARAHLDRIRATAASEQMDAALRRILDARESADSTKASIDALLSLRPSRSQGELLAEVNRLMKDSDWNLRQWQQPVENQIEVAMTVPRANPEQLVSDWEASPMFSGVTIDVSGHDDEVAIMARIDASPDGEAP